MPGKPSAKKTKPTAGLPVQLRDQAQQSAEEFKNLNPSTLLVLLAMYRTFSVLDRNQTDELATNRLNSSQFNTLTVLYRARNALTMRQLAEMMAVQPTNLSGIVKALRIRGLVQQQLNAQDTRSLLVSLTEEGERFLRGFLPGHWRHIESLMAALSEKKRSDLVRLLEELAESIKLAEECGAEGSDSPISQKRIQ
jgi:DNA-binding MarR family transcriptional regulator